jgi:hypothetical protein
MKNTKNTREKLREKQRETKGNEEMTKGNDTN